MSNGNDDDTEQHKPAPISKRKARATDETSVGSASARRKPHKVPRLDLDLNGPSLSSSVSPSTGDAGHEASRTQRPPLPLPPASPSSRKKNGVPTFTPNSVRASRFESANSGRSTSSSDFPKTLSQAVQKVITRDKEREREKEKEKTREQRDEAGLSRRGLPSTARKHTAPAKNIRKVSTAGLLKNAQKPDDSRNESVAWTRIRPKWKPKRTSYEDEMGIGRARPLDVARQRGGDDVELIDLSDLARRPRPSQPSATSGRRQNASANNDDPIIIISSSEDDRSPAIRPTQRRKTGPAGTQGNGANRTRAPPPTKPEVILISDSEEEAGAGGVVAGRPTVLASGANRVTPPLHPPQGPPGAPSSAPKPATVPAPAPAQLSEPPLSTKPQGTQQKAAEPPSQPSPSSSYGPPPDDFDDPFNDVVFDTTGDDANSDGPLEGWDGLNIGSSLATLPVAVSSRTANAATNTRTSVPEGDEDVSGQDAFFDSYVNIDQLEGDTDRAMGEDALLGGGGDGGEGREAEGGAASGLGVSTREGEGSSIAGSGDGANVDGDGDVRMQSLEEGEVDPNDVPVPSTRRPDTPESGEIRSQEVGQEVRTMEGELPSSGSVAPGRVSSSSSSEPVVAKHAPTSTIAHPTSSASASLSPSSGSPRSTASQPLGRTRMLVMPDISSYKGMRFKRPLPGGRENSFFSRALSGTGRLSGKAPVSVGERSALGGAPVEVPSSVGEVPSRDAGDADMQDDTATTMPDAVAPAQLPSSSPSPLAQQPAEAQPKVSDTQSTSSTARVRPPVVEPSTTTTDGLPASTSTQPTPSQAPSATQSLPRSSSRPFIAPPRIPRPSAPMSLVDALNEVRRERLEAFEEQRELARRRNVVDLTAVEEVTASGSGSATTPAPPTSAGQGPVEARPPSQPSQPSTPTPSSSRSQSTRVLGRTPSLNDIRTLLARRNVSASQPSRPTLASTSTPTPTPTCAFDEDGDTRVPAGPVTVPAPGLTDGDDQLALPSEGTSTKSTTVSALGSGVASGGPSASASASAKRRRDVSFVSFEAFISPTQSRGKSDRDHDDRQGERKSKGKEIAYAEDAFVSPTATRSRVSMGASPNMTLLGSQKSKGRKSRHGRRESASTAFMAYIVRDSPKQTSGARSGAGTDTDAGARTGTDDVQQRPGTKPLSQTEPPKGPKLSESGSVSVPSSPSVVSPVVSVVAPVMVQSPVSGVGGYGPADDTNAMDVDVGDGCIDLTRVDDGVALGESESVGEGEPDTRNGDEGEGGEEGEEEKEGEDEGEDEPDGADALLELASVHLSQTEAEVKAEVVAVDEADKVGEMDVIDESVVDAMMVDGSPEDLETHRGDEGQTILDDLPSQNVGNVLVEECDTIASSEPLALVENTIENTRAVASEERVIQAVDPVEISSHVTTPDLILPEDDGALSVEPPSKDSDQNVEHDHTHQRRRSGDADSMDECVALLTVRAECESESEVVPSDSTPSSRTASSTSLAPRRSRSRSPRHGSKRRSHSRATSSVDAVDLLRPPASVSDQAKDGHTSELTTGRHRITTWASHVAEERERPPEFRLARDLPHSLQDNMNVLPASFRNSPIAREIFEAHIREAMNNELEAPSIEIFDNGIGEEVTPPWEFHYTNEMWHGEGVPPPDVKGLEGCDCVGVCDPKSGNCACAQRQLRWVRPYIDGEIIPPTWSGSPFVYDHKGLLQRLECPIFECNRFCRCDEDCPNRVVQNGRKWPVHIAKTAHKGWGVFAGNKKIPKGAYLGIYAGELLTEQEGEARGRYYDMYGRTYLFSVDFHHLKLGMENPDDWENLYVVDAYHAGNFARFLNHSCDPNCKIFACYIDDADVNKPLLAVFTTREVEPWEELCFSYYGDIDEKREEIEAARDGGEEMVREHAVYAQCRCEAENCIGRLFG